MDGYAFRWMTSLRPFSSNPFVFGPVFLPNEEAKPEQKCVKWLSLPCLRTLICLSVRPSLQPTREDAKRPQMKQRGGGRNGATSPFPPAKPFPSRPLHTIVDPGQRRNKIRYVTHCTWPTEGDCCWQSRRK